MGASESGAHHEGGSQAEGSGAARPGQARLHFGVAMVLVVLTIIAFFAAGKQMLPTGVLFPLILFLALVQVLLQTLFYMRLRWDSRLFALVFSAGIVLAVFISLIVRVLINAKG